MLKRQGFLPCSIRSLKVLHYYRQQLRLSEGLEDLKKCSQRCRFSSADSHERCLSADDAHTVNLRGLELQLS